MPPADTAEEHDDLDGAEPGTEVVTETPGDQPDARPTDADDKSEPGSDDSDATSDPLLLAQQEPETPPAKPVATTTPPKPADAPKPGAAPKQEGKPTPKAAGDQPKPQEPAPAQDEPEAADAVADLPPEDWSKLSHKAKSQFLSQRKVLRTNAERLKAEAKARAEAEERYGAVERFQKDQGLSDEEYVNAVAVGGLVKRGDKRAVQVLEATLKNLRTRAGIPEPTAPAPAAPAAPALDDDLAAVLREAEEYGIDTKKVRTRFTATPPAVQPPVQQQQPPAAQPPAVRQQAPAAPVAGGDAENQSIIDALVGLGVDEAKVIERVSELMQADPALKATPPGQRLRAIVQAHQAKASRAPAAPPRTTGQPLSGRGRPAVPTGRTNTTANDDPLKHAMRPGR